MTHLSIFFQYLFLGCISFGGPAAHIAYFRRYFVEQKAWLDDARFTQLLALCQFLPGPASSQLGFAIALQRAGVTAAILAFIGFTLPSALLMYWLATGGGSLMQHSGLLAGMKLLAAVVVADAIWVMASQFCRRRSQRLWALVAAATLLLWPLGGLQLLIIVMAVSWAGLTTEKTPAPSTEQPQKLTLARLPRLYLLGFALLLLLSLACLLLGEQPLFLQFYQVGSLVFGGGHVVLPLLQSHFSQLLSADQFLLGYSAAQAVPGPMFSLAAFLGAELWPEQAWQGSVIASLGIFLPGFLLVLALLPIWTTLAEQPRLRRVVATVNAVAVGFLLSAWLGLVLPAVPASVLSLGLGLAGFSLLRLGKITIVVLIPAYAGLGWLLL